MEMHKGCVYVMTKNNKVNQVELEAIHHAAIVSTIRKHKLFLHVSKIEPIIKKNLPYVYIILKWTIFMLTDRYLEKSFGQKELFSR